ncbi:FAD-dependent monooxygenase [Sphingosinicella sp. BN140058]|uniref:FAD-dependent monooxygenase n=1 Tax=Sphingosinicella sp. BN140058 TaxID=1892855 RepID=UPI001010C96D|nr:FAD-dependent monooxygenase [Sphingosinicella sp. BN140058]QAY75407.1 FAD-dependent oxidoreductase [Sphingosinicella sp. BN140058]
MNEFTPDHHDVLIAGAGPVGLFLACELRLAGCSVLILEQAIYPSTPLKRAPLGLRGLSLATIESFDRRNLLEPLKARISAREIAAAAPWMKEERRPGGHFAGIKFFLDQINQERWSYRLQDSASPMAADLESIGAVLTDRALQLGVTIRYGLSVSHVGATNSDVTVRASGETFRASWLVGCDGGRSAVRKAAGFGFTGSEPEFTGYFAEVEVADPSMLEPGHHDTSAGTYIFDLPHMIRMVEFDGGAHHRGKPITRDHLQTVLRRVSGKNVELNSIGQVTTWTDRAYLATEYRRGRVLLAGDAAHIHSPLGGQGLNLGLGDAMNLGWKLAATIRGDAAAELIDSYQLERRPVAEQILDWSRAQVALMRPSRSAQALRAIVGDLIATREGATYFAERVWGVSLRYDLGSDHPLVGLSAPNYEIDDGTRLNEHLSRGRALLLDFRESDRLRTLADRYRDQVTYSRCNSNHPSALHILLVRADGFVAWASERPYEEADVVQAIAQWFDAAGDLGRSTAP